MTVAPTNEQQHQQRAMRLRRVTLLLSTALLGALTACAPETVTAPGNALTPSYGKGPGESGWGVSDKDKDDNSGPGKWKALKRTRPVYDETKTQRIGPKGGTIELKESGLKITVPEGALFFPIDITVSRVDNDDIAYEFQPHGLIFMRPLTFSQDLKDTEFDGIKSLGSLQGAYFKDVSQFSRFGAWINELMQVRLKGNRVEMDIWHFSGYMMSTGRAESPDSPEF